MPKRIRIPIEQVQTRTPAVAHNDDPVDSITVNIPLMVRLLEHAREDVKTDVELHLIVERMIVLSKDKQILTMNDYRNIAES